MLKKRIIPCLDIKNGRTVKGVNFLQLRDAGDPVKLAEEYTRQGADELAFLDISATTEQRKTLIPLVEHIARRINIPFTVGGGINSVEDAANLIRAGADKISINSAAVRRPDLITEIASRFGSQCVVVALDIRLTKGQWEVYIDGGTKNTGYNAMHWSMQAERLGAGELLLTSMGHDGTKNGFALEITEQIAGLVSIPVIASGGAGNTIHFQELFEKTNASAALAAGIFHFRELSIYELKIFLKDKQIPIR
jgi:cyclase